MSSFLASIFYIFAFLSVYVQIFFLITFLEKRKKIIRRDGPIDLAEYPGVTIVVPCYNEEKTISKTVNSILALDYPKDKLKLILVDDGSRDNTWEVIKSFEKFDNIKTFHKENGGKYTCLNLAIEKTETPFVGCLDADSFVDTHALKRIMSYFLNDPLTMAVAPSILVHNPKNLLQHAQKAEYDMAVYNKKMLGFIGGIHVTPGPFSIFRKKVFDDLGLYRHAHNTEDQEIALRMQTHGYKIEHCPDAYVYTISPNTVKKLYRQRLRWIYGFIKNAADYRFLLFKKKYGNIAFFTLPSGIISVVSVVFLLVFFMHNLFTFLSDKFTILKTVGFSSHLSHLHFDWFFVNTKAISFISIVLYGLVIMSLLLGRRMAEGRIKISFNIFYFIIVYSLIAPFWMLKAIYNSIISKESSWTLEREAKLN